MSNPNKISSSQAVEPLEWYNEQIKIYYLKFQDFRKMYYAELNSYNVHISKLFSCALRVHQNIDDKKTYKEMYKDVCQQFERLGDLYSKMLLASQCIDELKKARKDIYGYQIRAKD